MLYEVITELLGQGLSGKGRANTKLGRIAQSVFLQVIDPEAEAECRKVFALDAEHPGARRLLSSYNFV